MRSNEVCKNNQNSNGFHFIVTSTESSMLKFSLGGEKSLSASLVISTICSQTCANYS